MIIREDGTAYFTRQESMWLNWRLEMRRVQLIQEKARTLDATGLKYLLAQSMNESK